MKYSDERLKFFHEDCVTGMAKLDPGSIDLIVTSPPYNLGIDYGVYDDNKTKTAYLDWTVSWATQAHRVLADTGSLFLNIGGSLRNPLLPHEVVLELSQLFVLQNTFHWIKAITIQTREGEVISTGHFKPINSQRYVNDCHEYIFHLTKAGETPLDRLAVGVPYTDKSNITRWQHTNGKDRRCRGNTWFIPYKTITSRDQQRPHPASFPKELPIACIRLHGWRRDIVMMDPFLGIGSSAVAAKELDIAEFIGFEIDADYLAAARAAVGISKPCQIMFQPLAFASR